jgi:energy-converting hydrogenase Eha subunit E
VLQRGLVGSGDSLIPQENIAVFLALTFKHLLSRITFIAWFTFLELQCYTRIGT